MCVIAESSEDLVLLQVYADHPSMKFISEFLHRDNQKFYDVWRFETDTFSSDILIINNGNDTHFPTCFTWLYKLYFKIGFDRYR